MPRQKRTSRTELRCAWFLCVVGASALLVQAAIGSRTGIRDGYRMAVEQAFAHPATFAAFGEPVEAQWLPELSFDKGEDRERLGLLIRLSGPRAEGLLHMRATRRRGPWRFEELRLEVEGRDQPIDLLDDHGTAPSRDQSLDHQT